METVPALDAAAFRRRILRWYDGAKRSLPWRETSDPWRILVSEIMLQQTRVEAVIPYYLRFLEQFPTAGALAAAPEETVLAAWSGLGYYSRARNLQRAAREIGDRFPSTFEAIRALPGIGPYTGAAVGSIAWGLPHAAVDGNVLRVVSRVACDSGDIGASVTRARFTAVAQELLDPRRPGDFNQAMMELGATICVPRNPVCLLCPVAKNCLALQAGRQRDLPVKRLKKTPSTAVLQVVIVKREGRVLLRPRGEKARRMAGFWELPELGDFPGSEIEGPVALFRHTIVNTVYTIEMFRADVGDDPPGMRWFSAGEMAAIPLTTISRKALALCSGD